ncbi:MAG: FRG domain-containing protein [Phycisphaerae bacterium]|nr:FRG domain-containing protein [Phycisphaerae bacterium]
MSVEYPSWNTFKSKALDRYVRLSAERRSQLIFRGQAQASWVLETSLDRHFAGSDDEQRRQYRKLILKEFRRAVMGLDRALSPDADDVELEILARHHGLPSPVLDWSESPYVAAFFAYESEVCLESDKVAIWLLDREVLNKQDCPEINLIDDENMVWYNPRAIEQRAVSMIVESGRADVESLIGKGVYKYELPSSERGLVLADLDEMLINARLLYRDLDGAARTALARTQLTQGARP